MPRGQIATDDPCADDVRALLERHLAYANANSAPEDVHALDVDALLDPAVTFFSFRVDGELLGVAALKRLDGRHAEIKSMHTAKAARGRGIGRALVEAVLAAAGERGVVVRPVGRNAEAIRFFHALGFDVLSRVELLRHSGDLWRRGERVAGRDLRV